MATFSDINKTFELNALGDISLVTDRDSISQSIYNILNTVKGFRPGEGNEFYGVGINNFLFTNMSPFVAQQIGKEIQSQIEDNEQRIEIENIDIKQNFETYSYDISIFYNILNLENKRTEVYKLVLKTM